MDVKVKKIMLLRTQRDSGDIDGGRTASANTFPINSYPGFQYQPTKNPFYVAWGLLSYEHPFF